jgi:hypothetical protein
MRDFMPYKTSYCAMGEHQLCHDAFCVCPCHNIPQAKMDKKG